MPADHSVKTSWSRPNRRLSRRGLLRASARAGVGAAGLALVGCGGEDEPAQQAVAEEMPQEQAQVQAQVEAAEQQAQQAVAEDAQAEAQVEAEPELPTGPVPGGIARLWLGLERIDAWDPHRARNRQTQAVMSLMYNRLLRPAAADGDELEADLCALPEMPDEQTYIFTITPLARFWNRAPTEGRALTADDVRFNVERQQAALDSEGAADASFVRQADYLDTASVEATDARTVRMTSFGPDVQLLQAHSGPWAWITSPEAAAEYGDEWGTDPTDIQRSSGTGPYVPRAFNPAEQLALARSGNWWGSGDRAYPAGFIFTGQAQDAIVAAYNTGELDWLGFPAPNEYIRNTEENEPDHVVLSAPLDYGVQLLAPLADGRIARAASLALDRPALAERWYGEEGTVEGIVPSHLEQWALPQDRLAEFPGYRGERAADLAEAARLLEEAGGADAVAGTPLVVGDLFESALPGSGAAVASMLEEAGIHVRPQYRSIAQAFRDMAAGEKFLYLGFGRPLQRPDPTWEWGETLHSLALENWSVPKPSPGNGDLDETLDRMRATLDLDARRELAAEVQERLLSGDARQWVVPIASGKRLSIRKPYLNLHEDANAFAWSHHRLAQSWLDASDETYPADRVLPDPPPPPEPPAEEPAADAGNGAE